MSFRINREFGRDANKINKCNDDVGCGITFLESSVCKQWSGVTIEWRKPRVCHWKRTNDRRGIFSLQEGVASRFDGLDRGGPGTKQTRLLWRERRTVSLGQGCFETTHEHRCSLAVARGAVSIGRPFLGMFGVRVGNGEVERTSVKDNDHSDNDSTSSSSSRHKTIERETKKMTTATTQT